MQNLLNQEKILLGAVGSLAFTIPGNVVPSALSSSFFDKCVEVDPPGYCKIPQEDRPGRAVPGCNVGAPEFAQECGQSIGEKVEPPHGADSCVEDCTGQENDRP